MQRVRLLQRRRPCVRRHRLRRVVLCCQAHAEDGQDGLPGRGGGRECAHRRGARVVRHQGQPVPARLYGLPARQLLGLGAWRPLIVGPARHVGCHPWRERRAGGPRRMLRLQRNQRRLQRAQHVEAGPRLQPELPRARASRRGQGCGRRAAVPASRAPPGCVAVAAGPARDAARAMVAAAAAPSYAVVDDGASPDSAVITSAAVAAVAAAALGGVTLCARLGVLCG
mmetsp:Transcript_51603/g.171004  ORF Transcript_51603/g.171004 Transcript_51603/m.171004 type:complete len:226 (-) Transcript_51603:486-1163(-)